MLSTHSLLDQTQGPTASVNSKEMGRLFHEIVQTIATLESGNNDKQSQQLFLIYYSQARNQRIAISSHQDKPEFFISLTNIVLLGKIL